MNWSIRHPAFIVFFLAAFNGFSSAQEAPPYRPTAGTVFPSDNEVLWRTLSSAIHLLGVSILASIIARRSEVPTRGWTSMPIARWLCLLIFADSWLFLFSAGLLISGVGLSLNSSACSAGIFLCIVLYAISKILIYWFLVEKVHLVHPHPSHDRLKSPAYLLCILFVLGYGVVILLAITGRIAWLRDGTQTARGTMYDTGNDGACIIGLGRPASMTLLIYDAILNVFFTSMFLYPVYNSNNISPRLQRVAKTTLLAAVVSLVTSAINICVLTILHGQELGWICLASCAADVAINAMAIYAVTGNFDDHTQSEHSVTMEKQADPIGAGNHKRSRFTVLSEGMRRMVSNPKPHLPIVNAGTTSSSRSILEKSKHSGRSAVTSTRSIHFSPDTSRQSRGFPATEHGEIDNVLGSVSQGDILPAGSSALGSASSLEQGNAKPNVEVKRTGDPTQHGRVSISRIGHREPFVGARQLRENTSPGTSLSTVGCSQPDPSEDIFLEVRHERPALKLTRRHSLAVPPGLLPTARKTSHISERREGQRDETTQTGDAQTPPVHDEVLDRRKVLSALGEIGGGKRKTDLNALEVSVVTRIDRRIERMAPVREDLLDDYHGRRYDRRGRSWSSSGGF